jgi:hypothetical protein
MLSKHPLMSPSTTYWNGGLSSAFQRFTPRGYNSTSRCASAPRTIITKNGVEDRTALRIKVAGPSGQDRAYRTPEVGRCD